jgi:hypothetical protein
MAKGTIYDLLDKESSSRTSGKEEARIFCCLAKFFLLATRGLAEFEEAVCKTTL